MMSEGPGFSSAGSPDKLKQDSAESRLRDFAGLFGRSEPATYVPDFQGTRARGNIEWDKIAYRVSRIPSNFRKELLVSVVGCLFDIEASDLEIHSLAYDASDESEPRYKTATMTFRTRPPQLDPACAESGYWSLNLEREGTEEYDSDRIYFDNHFEGFTPLSPAEKSDEQTIDFVVIHGWAGHALGSFKSPRPPYVWLRDSLPKRCSQLRIWTYGYRSELTNQQSIADVFEYAKTFKQQLCILRQKTKANENSIPIIFMVHSLGGWILKEAMTRMRYSTNEDDRLNLLSTYGALFFGVPSHGMNVEALASMVLKTPARYTLNLLDQQLGFSLREKLHTDFCRAFDYPDSKIVQFYELEKSPTVIQDTETGEWSRKGRLELLVNPESAACGRSWETGDDYVMSLEGNHSDMVKFLESDRNGYEKICKVLKDFIKVAPSIIKARKDSFEVPQLPEKPNEFTKDQKACLKSLYFPEMHCRRDEIDIPAHTTCQWILEHESYQKWFRDQRGLLWIKGKPGAGKSTVLKYAFDAAKQNNEGLILASFFFHGRGSFIQKSALGLYRSLIHQILQQVPDLLTKFTSLYRQRCNTEGEYGQKWDWRERDLQNFFSSHVTETAKKFSMRLYIDALDECGQDPAISLVEFFCRFADPIAICFTCRHYPIIPLEETGFEISVEHENATDIDAYITNRIEPAVRNVKFANAIRHELKERSAGNFQWVVLVTRRVLQSHRSGKPLTVICADIRRLPPELATLYEEIMGRTEPDDMTEALHLFQWICFAFRPLTLQELREATALDIHTSYASLQESRTFSQYAETDEEMERRVLGLSHGLAEVVEHDSERIVQLVHQSVMDFLLQDGFRLFYEQLPDDRLKGSVIARGHFWISRACIKYISMEEVVSLRIGDLESEKQRRALHREHSKKFVFIKYASMYWITHAQIVERENISQDDLVELLQPKSSILHALGEWDWGTKDVILDRVFLIRQGMTMLHIASTFGLSKVVTRILEQDARTAEIDARDSYEITPLHCAAEAGHEAIVKRFLEAGAAVDPRGDDGGTPAFKATHNGHKNILELLLKWGAKADAMDDYGETPLFRAARRGFQTIVELLLEQGARADTRNFRGLTPISLAAFKGYEPLVRLLLEHGANPDSVDEKVISLAAREGFNGVVKVIQCAKEGKPLPPADQLPPTRAVRSESSLW